MKNKLYPEYIVAIVLTIILSIMLIRSSIISAQPPNPFPLDDMEATYTVEKKDGFWWVHYQSRGQSNIGYDNCYRRNFLSLQTCEKKVLEQNISVIVDSSPIALEPYSGKNLTLKGHFSMVKSAQCIARVCHYLDSNAYHQAFTITYVAEKK